MSLSSSDRVVRENTTAVYTAHIKDQDGVAISAASLDALTLTLYDYRTSGVINTRDGQDVLNANDVTVTAEGLLTWTMQPADNAIVGNVTPGGTEKHIALFQWTWDTTKYGKYEVTIEVSQLEKVT